MATVLFQVSLDYKSARTLNRTAELFVLPWSDTKLVSAVTDLAFKAARTAVPIKTGELRNQHHHQLVFKQKGRVSIDSSDHISTIGKKKPHSDVLGIKLHENKYKRSRTSVPDSGIPSSLTQSGSTFGWIDRAEDIVDILIDREIEKALR